MNNDAAAEQQPRRDQYDDPTDFNIFELSLDAASDIAGLTVAVQSLSQKVLEVRVDIYNSFTPRWTEEGISELFETLGNVPHLLKLEFYGLRIFPYLVPIAMIERTLSLSSRLEELALVGIKVSGEENDFEDFSKALRKHTCLTSFCLDNCKLRNETEGPSLDEAIIRFLPEIKTLKNLNIRAMEPSAWSTISSDSVRLLCSLPNLSELELFVFSPHSSALLMVMASALIEFKDRTQLTHLSIAGSMGGLEGGKAISNMLAGSKMLQSLELHLREGSEEEREEAEKGAIEISNALSRNQSLTSFQLHGVPAASGGLKVRNAFLAALQNNYTLTENVQVFHPGFLRPENEFYLKLNRQGRGRLFQNNNVTREDCVDALFNVRNDLPCLYYFLSMNPLLCASSSTSDIASAADDDNTVSRTNASPIDCSKSIISRQETCGKRVSLMGVVDGEATPQKRQCLSRGNF